MLMYVYMYMSTHILKRWVLSKYPISFDSKVDVSYNRVAAKLNKSGRDKIVISKECPNVSLLETYKQPFFEKSFQRNRTYNLVV